MLNNDNYFLLNTQIENVTIPEGTKRFHLRCVKGVNVTWKKDDKIIYFPRNEKFKLTGMSPDELPLLCVKKTNKFEGNYTCHASKSSPPLKQINVQVMGRYITDENTRIEEIISPRC